MFPKLRHPSQISFHSPLHLQTCWIVPQRTLFFLMVFMSPILYCYRVSIDFFLSRFLKTSWSADSWNYTIKFLTWFYNPTQWISLLQQEKSKWPHAPTYWIEVHCSTLHNKSVKQAFAYLFSVFIFHRPFKASTDNLVMSFPQAAL